MFIRFLFNISKLEKYRVVFFKEFRLFCIRGTCQRAGYDCSTAKWTLMVIIIFINSCLYYVHSQLMIRYCLSLPCHDTSFDYALLAKCDEFRNGRPTQLWWVEFISGFYYSMWIKDGFFLFLVTDYHPRNWNKGNNMNHNCDIYKGSPSFDYSYQLIIFMNITRTWK